MTFGQEQIFASKQEKIPDTSEVKRIDKLVNNILSNKEIQRIRIDSIALPNKFDKQQFYNLDIYHKENKIVRITASEILPRFFLETGRKSPELEQIDYFINRKGLYYIVENYQNCSRMGSCGCIRIVNKIYYRKNKILGTITNDFCYQTPIKIDWLYGKFEKIYKIARERMEKEK